MNIAMLSDSETEGGAAIAAARLAQALCQEGHQVTRLVALSDGQEHSWTTNVVAPSRRLYRRLGWRLLPSWARGRMNALTVQGQLDRALDALRPNIINVHNIHSAADVGWRHSLVRVCAAHAPVAWTLHDMWSFTGRCAYSYDCRRFVSGCDSTCPTATEYPVLAPDQISGAWAERHRFLSDYPSVVAATPSHWLAGEAQTGLWAGHRIEVIPNGLPVDTYRSFDRRVAREALGIETVGPVLMVAAQHLTERRKGAALLAQALQRLRHRPLTLLTLGAGRLSAPLDGVQVQDLGYIRDERAKVLVFNAADVFVHPAPVDNLPNVVVESLACGTPVVGFPVGGMAEMVRPGRTGWLAKEVSAQALAVAIAEALHDLQHGVDLRISCSSVAQTEYSADLQASRYVALFRSLLQDETGLRDER